MSHALARRNSATALVAALLVVGASLTLATAAGLSVSSTGVAIENRTYGSALTCTVTAVADTYVRSDQTGTSLGSQTTLDVNAMGSATRRAFIRFDLSGCAPQIASDAIIHSATVR